MTLFLRRRLFLLERRVVLKWSDPGNWYRREGNVTPSRGLGGGGGMGPG